MTQKQIVEFIREKHTPGAITWGDYKKLQVLEFLLGCKLTKIPVDSETVAIYTKMEPDDIASTIESMIAEGLITRTQNPVLENEILTLNIEGDGNEGQS